MVTSSMHPQKQLALFFLKQIQHYYPIGLPNFPDDYPGFQQMQQIQKAKFEAIEQEEPKNWYALVDDVRKQWSGYQVFNAVAAQFPCYELIITLKEESLTGLRKLSSLTLSVSLLVKYYAVIVTDHYVYYGGEYTGVAHKVVCSGFKNHLELDDKIESLKEIVARHFPDYQYVNHDVLFKYKIHGGFPYHGNYDDLGEYTIYDYLFSGGLFKQKYTVAH